MGFLSHLIIWIEVLSKQCNFTGHSQNFEPHALNKALTQLYNLFGLKPDHMALDGDSKSHIILKNISEQFAKLAHQSVVDCSIKICPDKAHIIAKQPRPFAKLIQEAIQEAIDKLKNKNKNCERLEQALKNVTIAWSERLISQSFIYLLKEVKDGRISTEKQAWKFIKDSAIAHNAPTDEYHSKCAKNGNVWCRSCNEFKNNPKKRNKHNGTCRSFPVGINRIVTNLLRKQIFSEKVLAGIILDMNTSIVESGNSVINRFIDKQSFIKGKKHHAQVMRGGNHWNNPFRAVFKTLEKCGIPITKRMKEKSDRLRTKRGYRAKQYKEKGPIHKSKYKKTNGDIAYQGNGGAIADICEMNNVCNVCSNNNKKCNS
eukprot:144793_1